jgi:hypothetical protein
MSTWLIVAICLAAVVGVIWGIWHLRPTVDPRFTPKLVDSSGKSLIGLLGENVGDLGSRPTEDQDYPKEAIVWRVTIDRVGKNLIIKYGSRAKFTIGQGDSEVRKFLAAVAADTYPENTTWQTVDYDQYRDLRTPLSIEYNGHALMVFVLDDHNWYFTQRTSPFQVAKGGKGKRFYRDARCAWGTSAEEEAGENDDCKVASFIANANGDWQKNGKIKPDGQKEFSRAFNIYVTLRVPLGNKTRYLPLIIDPDVGYPGGVKP